MLNAANEEAVAAFLDGAIRFTDIHRVNEGTVGSVRPAAADCGSLDDLLALDARARAQARQLIEGLKR